VWRIHSSGEEPAGDGDQDKRTQANTDCETVMGFALPKD
jgi:hypothetical protein